MNKGIPAFFGAVGALALIGYVNSTNRDSEREDSMRRQTESIEHLQDLYGIPTLVDVYSGSDFGGGVMDYYLREGLVEFRVDYNEGLHAYVELNGWTKELEGSSPMGWMTYKPSKEISDRYGQSIILDYRYFKLPSEIFDLADNTSFSVYAVDSEGNRSKPTSLRVYEGELDRSS